jgi:hypothetical protein
LKCWECKKDVSKARIVHYYSPIEGKTASRDICFDCLPKLQFNPCNHVEVKSIRSRVLKGVNRIVESEKR